MSDISAVNADGFSGFKKFEAVPFSIQNLQLLTAPIRKEAVFESPDPSIQIASLLNHLRCSTILVEKNYTDRDYKAEFSALYAKRFYTPHPRCDRLHFFSVPILVKNLFSQIDQLNDNSYLGYCVVRPTEFNRVGRTVIQSSTLPAPQSTRGVKHYITCEALFRPHILGRCFEVNGFPFIQQDTQVGACAHAALWMAGRYMSALGYCPEFLPAEINILAKARQSRGRTFPAEQGLVTIQMLDGLHGMGLSAIHYNRINFPEKICEHIKISADSLVDGENEIRRLKLESKKLADLAYRYIESRLPVILTTKDHAVVGLGHTLAVNPNVPNNIDRIPSLLINDDGYGPYVELPVDPGAGKYSFDDVLDLIAVLPGAVMLRGEYAEESARSTLELMPDLLGAGNKRQIKESARLRSILTTYRLRTYLLSASEFQRDLRLKNPSERLAPEVTIALTRLDYPQYIWISEVFISDKNGQRCIGKIILDSTAAKSDRSVMAVVLGKMAILFDRRNPHVIPFAFTLNDECRFSSKNMGTMTT